VTDGELAAERGDVGLVEDMADEPEVAPRDDGAAAVGGRDTGRLLAAVLERVEREERQARDVTGGGVDAEDTALIARAVTHRCA